ncbi:hypothetical protein [Actinoplanes rectilineatus]|uniref:hypothetical protein n=1 Tax=Actinoplanes rectilineatus TaxID=113571 RepID=UPI0006980BF2|nr:hypothetical protein [Actinoplanes rectilineatus]
MSRPPIAWGDPVRAVIAPAGCGGYILFTYFSVGGRRRTGVDLGIRWDAYTEPLPGEVAAADAGLTLLGLTRTTPWSSGRSGSLTAAVIRTPLPAGWARRGLCRLSLFVTTVMRSGCSTPSQTRVRPAGAGVPDEQ